MAKAHEMIESAVADALLNPIDKLPADRAAAMAVLSMAISLKRIADAFAPTEGRSRLDDLNEVLTDFTNNLSSTLRDARG